MSILKATPIPTRYPKGVTNVKAEHPLAYYGLPDPATWHSYFNDWSYYQANQWTVNSVGTSTVALASGDGGVLSVATGATLGNSCQHTGVAPGFLPEATKQMIFRARFALNDATNSAFQFGLVNATPTLLNPTDGFYFSKAAASTSLVLNSEAGSTVTSTPVATLANGVFVDACGVYDGRGNVHAFINGTHVGMITPAAVPSVILTRDFEIQASTAAAQTMLLDYLFFAKPRDNFGRV